MRWFWIALLGSVLGRGGHAAGQASGALDDDALARRVSSGDAEAFALLYDRHSRAVFSLALRVLGDQAEAEDVVQEVFAQAWRQANRYDAGRGQPVAWLLNMARSRAIDRGRRRRHVVAADDREMPETVESSPGAEAVVISAAEAQAVRRALADLPPLQRAAIELAYYEGLSQTEIAQRLEEPLGTVKTRVRLGLLKMREAMAGSRA